MADTAELEARFWKSLKSDMTAMLALADGRVLVAGGSDAVGARADAEIFDPVDGAFGFAGTMAAAREAATAALLADGRVLVAGGADFFDEGAWRSAEAYRAPIPDPIFADGFERAAE